MSTDKLVILGEFNDQISPALKNVESGVIRLVGSVSAALTALAAIAAPVTLTASFQKEMLNVKKTTDFSSDAIRTLGKDIVDLSKTINVSADDLAKIAALGGQLGVGNLGGASGLIAFTEEIARAVTALDVNAEEAATSLGKLINIFEIPPEKYRNVIAAINELSNVSTAKPEELFDIMRRIGNLGGSVKVDQSAALSATMIDLGLTAETAGTSLTKVFADMKADAASFASLMGISTSQWSQIVQDDGITALKMYLAKLNELPPAVAAATKQQMTGGGRIFELITKLQADSRMIGGGVLNQRLNTGEEEFKTGTSAMREQQTVLSGLSAQWAILGNTLKGAAIEAGNASLGPLTESVRKLSVALDSDAFSGALAGGLSYVADGIAYVVDAMSSLTASDLDWQLILGAGTAAAAAGILSVLTAAIGLLTASLARSAGSAGGFIATLGGITTAVTKANAAMSKTGQDLFTKTFVNRADGAMRLATQEQAAWDTSKRQLESQLGAYKNFMMRRAEAYRQQRIAPLENIQASGGTLTTQQTRQLNGYRLHYAQLNRLSQLSMNDLVENEQNLVRMQRIVQDRGFAAELEAYRRQRQNRNAANLDLQDSLTDLQGNLDLTASGRGAQGFSGMIAGVREFLTQNRRAFAVAQTGASATERAMVSLRNTMNTVSTAALNIRTAMLQLTGDTARFAAAQTLVGRSAVVTRSLVTAAYLGMGVAIRAASVAAQAFGAAVSKAFAVLAVVQMVAALADMLGMLDPIKKGLAAIIKSMGFKPPEFLKTAAEIDAEAAAVRKLADEYDRVAVAAEKFQQKFGVISVGIAVDEKGADIFTDSVNKAYDKVDKAIADRKKQVTFDFADPKASGQAIGDLVDTVSAVAAQQEANAAAAKRSADEYARINNLLTEQQAKLTDLKRDDPQNYRGILDAQKAVDATSKEAEAAKKLAENRAVVVANTRAELAVHEGIRTILSALNPEQATALFFGGVTKGSKSAVDRIRELTVTAQKLKDTVRDDFKGNVTIDGGKLTGADQIKGDDLRRLQLLKDQYEAATAEIANLRNGLLEVPNLTEALGGKEQALKTIQALTSGTLDWRKEAERAIASAGGIAKAAQGLGSFVVPVNLTKTAIASSIRVALEYRNALGQMVATAEAAAKDAANAMNRAMERHKQDVRDLAAFSNNLAKSLTGQGRSASAQVATRSLEESTRSRLDGLNAAKSLETDILRTIEQEGKVNLSDIRERLRGLEAAREFGREQLISMLATGQITQEVYNRESKSLDDNVSKQRDILNYYYERGNMTREEAKAVSSVLDLKYRAASTKINDAADLERSKIAVDGIRGSYNDLKKTAEGYQTQLTAINRLLADESKPVADRASLLERRNEVAAALRTTLGSLRQETEKFAGTAPVAGKVVISEEEVSRMETFIQKMTAVQGQLDMQSAGLDKGIYDRLATQLQSQMAVYDEFVKSNLKAADAIKMPREELERLVAAAGKIPEVAKQLSTLSAALGAAATGDYAGFTGISFKPTDLVKSFQASMAAIPSGALNVEVPVLAKLSADTLPRMQAQLAAYFTASAKDAETQINTAGGIVVKGKIKVDKIEGPNGADISVDALGNRGYATGGPVYGAGTATSDSIPAWLSHGEYVMDAKTTRMFSPAFFARLQEMARRGVNLSAIRTDIRGFASGGLALNGGQYIATSLNSISESSTTEAVALDLSLNGNKRARLRGSREQVDAFTQALREVQKGIAR